MLLGEDTGHIGLCSPLYSFLGLKVWKSTRVSSKRQELVMILGPKLGFWCVFLWVVLSGQGRTVGPGSEVSASAKALRIVRAGLEGSVSTGGHQPLLPRQPHRGYIEAPGLYDWGWVH